MIADIGHSLLIAAWIASLLQACFIFADTPWAWFKHHRFYKPRHSRANGNPSIPAHQAMHMDSRLRGNDKDNSRSNHRDRYLPALSLGVCAIVSVAFFLLILGFIISDFEIATVYQHSHSLKPLIYKISGSWGNHEGSILLWCWMLTLYNAALSLRVGTEQRPLLYYALPMMGAIQAAFLLYMLLTSNPFATIYPAPMEGTGLNPLLQDIGLAMHPPLLYLGYVGFAAAFALAIAGLMTGRVDRSFATVLHPWIMVPWAALTLGIGLGSWWAYRELGWGGWWFWDPVENASLLPWLTGTALLHANLVMRKFGLFQRWVILLALITFTLSLFGTFLVRSGILTSVHSFASDPTRGLALLAMIAIIALVGLASYYRYSPAITRLKPVAFASREMLVLINNALLLLIMAGILLAMLYPILLQSVGGPIITIGTDYYNQLFRALTIPLLIGCGLSSLVIWNHTPKRKHLTRAAIIMICALSFAALWTYALGQGMLCFTGLALGLWIIASLIPSIYPNLHKNGWYQPRITPMVTGHFGLGLLVVSVTLQACLSFQAEFVMKPGDIQHMGEYELTLDQIEHHLRDNYVYRRAHLTLRNHKDIFQLYPEERYYPVSEKFTTEAYIDHLLTHDLYATIRHYTHSTPSSKEEQAVNPDAVEQQPVVITIHKNHAISWIWLGCLIIACSGLYGWLRCSIIK